MRARSTLGVWLGLALGCVHVAEPPAFPDRVVPAVRADLGPSAPGNGRVILDVVDGPAEVRETLFETSGSSVAVATSFSGGTAIGTSTSSSQTSRFVCTTPCSADLSYGSHALTFTLLAEPRRVEQAEVVAGQRPWVYRRAMGRPRHLEGWSVAIGLLLSLAGIGLEVAAIGASSDNLTLYGGGVGLSLAGAGIMLSNWSVQPGAVSQWYLDETPR